MSEEILHARDFVVCNFVHLLIGTTMPQKPKEFEASNNLRSHQFNVSFDCIRMLLFLAIVRLAFFDRGVASRLWVRCDHFFFVSHFNSDLFFSIFQILNAFTFRKPHFLLQAVCRQIFFPWIRTFGTF